MSDTPQMSKEAIDKLVGLIMSNAEKDDITALIHSVNYSKYEDDPIGFCEEVLGETLTDDIKEMMESVRDNQVTIAISSNATGKSHAAARVSVWFYLCHAGTKVFTAAAPPFENLKNILWGEIGQVIRDHPELFKGQDHTSLDVRRGPQEFLTGVTIPSAGTEEEKEAKFCADADDLFELTTGGLVTYGSLINKTVDVVSVDKAFHRSLSRAAFFDNGTEDVHEVITASGHKLIRTAKHPFYTGKVAQCFKTLGGTHVKGRYRVENEGWAPVSSMKSDDALLIPDDTAFNFGDETPDPNMVKVIAYLIGDGCISGRSTVSFFQEDNAQLADFRSAVSALGAKTSEYDIKRYRVNVTRDGKRNSVLDMLRECGLQGHDNLSKYVPDIINRSDRDSVSLFLNRLFSTDGWACMCRVGKDYTKAEIGYGSNSERLIRDIQRLLHRFGIFSTVRQKKTSWTYAGIRKHGTTWMCTICRSEDIVRFAEHIGIYGKESKLKECVDYAESRGAYASWRASDHPGFSWDRIRAIRLLGQRRTVGVHVPGNNTYLTNVVEHNSGKHQDFMLFTLDEGDAIPDAVYRGIESCMSGGHVRLLIMFNPRKSSGAVYRMIRDAEAGIGEANVVHLSAFRHPNVITGEDVIPGAVTRDKTVKRINLWTRPLRPGDKESERSVFTLPDFLAGTTTERKKGMYFPRLKPGKYKIVNPAFSYMVLGQYPAQGSNQLISEEWIAAARTRYDLYVAENGDSPPEASKGVMGLDVAEMGDDENIAVGRYGGYLTQFDAWSEVDPRVTGVKAVAWYKAHPGITRANVDATGVGSGVAPHMQETEGVVATGIKVAEKPTITTELGDFGLLRDELLWRLKEWLRTDTSAMLPPDEELIEELMALTYDTDSGKVRVIKTSDMKPILGRSPDRLMALAMTFAGATGFFADCDFEAFPS